MGQLLEYIQKLAPESKEWMNVLYILLSVHEFLDQDEITWYEDDLIVDHLRSCIKEADCLLRNE
jgi:hypothetical protein